MSYTPKMPLALLGDRRRRDERSTDSPLGGGNTV